eukprot:CFRG1084T1
MSMCNVDTCCLYQDNQPPRNRENLSMAIDWFPLLFVVSMHAGMICGMMYTQINITGLYSCICMYLLTGLSITVGYHRLWSHRSYSAIVPWRLWCAFWGAGAMQGSILWWSRLHRLHHSFPDTPADPYGPVYGFWYSHCGWMFEKKDRTQYLDRINVNDLKKDWIVMLQHKVFVPLQIFVAFGMPILLFPEDKVQSIIYGGFMARVLTWHSTWCVNSLAHWLGHDEYSNETSAKDHYLTALLTFGEGNHGFHHAFSFSYQNGLKWFHYDPTKQLIWLASCFGIAYNLKHPDENEIQKARYQVQERKILGLKQSIVWPDPSKVTNRISMGEYMIAKQKGNLWICINRKIYDIAEFASDHPGGAQLLSSMASKDPSYIARQYSFKHTHSKAARNMMDMMLIGILDEDHDHDQTLVKPTEQAARIVHAA